MSQKKFYAQKDDLGFPIPGTLMAAAKVPAVKNIIEIPAADTVVGTGQAAVAHPSRLRYFVRKDATGRIIPNSLIISLTRPKGLVYEFKQVR